jgi:agmatine deiminase
MLDYQLNSMNINKINKMPVEFEFRLPAEWEPREATWIAWPKNKEDWPGKFAPIPWVYVEIVRLLSRFETVKIVVSGKKREKDARERLERGGARLENVKFVHVATDRSWLRDTGPIFIVNDAEGTVACVDCKFNGWAKYENHERDDKFARRVAEELKLPRIVPEAMIDGEPRRIVLEGGAIDSNGKGTVLVTEECLLSDIQCRNPGLGRKGTEQALADYLGCSNVVWLGRGIVGDDTHGHVDDISRFVGEGTIVTVIEEDSRDPNYEPLKENLQRLHEARDQDGRPFEIIELPMPAPVEFEGVRLPASYANFYLGEKAVLVPVFNDPRDADALGIFGRIFTDREVVGVYARDLVWGLGTLHCLTRDQPKGIRKR